MPRKIANVGGQKRLSARLTSLPVRCLVLALEQFNNRGMRSSTTTPDRIVPLNSSILFSYVFCTSYFLHDRLSLSRVRSIVVRVPPYPLSFPDYERHIHRRQTPLPPHSLIPHKSSQRPSTSVPKCFDPARDRHPFLFLSFLFFLSALV